MQITFSKYQGAGNDFVIIDNRSGIFIPTADTIHTLCDRHFGIGADGLMLFEASAKADFHMRYFNADGHESTMCGNGGRCITLFAQKIGIIDTSTRFEGIDGEHEAFIIQPNYISLKMKDVDSLEAGDDYYLLDTGSPHFVCFVKDVQTVDVNKEGQFIRNSYNLNGGGTNVNFVQVSGEKLFVRTYERGVEAETLACGTGSVASAIAFNHYFDVELNEYQIVTPGGELKVKFKRIGESSYSNIWLEGPAHHTFDGTITL